MCLKIMLLKLLPHLLGANELNWNNERVQGYPLLEHGSSLGPMTFVFPLQFFTNFCCHYLSITIVVLSFFWISGTAKNSQRGNTSNDSGFGSSFSSTQSSRGFATQTSTQRTQTSTQRTPLAPRNQPGLMGLTNQRPNNPRPPGGQARGSRNSFGGGGGPDQGGGGQAIVCTCGEDARMLTVRKEGPNTGEWEMIQSWIALTHWSLGDVVIIPPELQSCSGGYFGFTPFFRSSVCPSCMLCLLRGSATIWWLCFIWGTDTTREWTMCHVPFPGQSVKVTWLIWIFSHVHTMAHCVCLQKAAYIVTCDVEINELFAFAVRTEVILVDHQSTISSCKSVFSKLSSWTLVKLLSCEYLCW